MFTPLFSIEQSLTRRFRQSLVHRHHHRHHLSCFDPAETKGGSNPGYRLHLHRHPFAKILAFLHQAHEARVYLDFLDFLVILGRLPHPRHSTV
jgi:hypothetical protein